LGNKGYSGFAVAQSVDGGLLSAGEFGESDESISRYSGFGIKPPGSNGKPSRPATTKLLSLPLLNLAAQDCCSSEVASKIFSGNGSTKDIRCLAASDSAQDIASGEAGVIQEACCIACADIKEAKTMEQVGPVGSDLPGSASDGIRCSCLTHRRSQRSVGSDNGGCQSVAAKGVQYRQKESEFQI
jgi:hypothetical protein